MSAEAPTRKYDPLEEDFSWVSKHLPRALASQWHGTITPNGMHWTKEKRGRKGRKVVLSTVMMTGMVEQDGRRWLHLSFSHPGRLPTWTEFVAVKELFLGREAKAIQVIPPRSEHVNIHPHCLHLFECVDGDPLPDFTQQTGHI